MVTTQPLWIINNNIPLFPVRQKEELEVNGCIMWCTCKIYWCACMWLTTCLQSTLSQPLQSPRTAGNGLYMAPNVKHYGKVPLKRLSLKTSSFLACSKESLRDLMPGKATFCCFREGTILAKSWPAPTQPTDAISLKQDQFFHSKIATPQRAFSD